MIKILIVNSPTKDIGDEIKSYFHDLTIEITYLAIDEKPPMVIAGATSTGILLYTPEGLPTVRKLCKPLEYHFALYCYNPSDYPQNTTTGGFTHSAGVYMGTYLATVRLDASASLYAIHELHHLFAQKLYKFGYPVKDYMDLTPVGKPIVWWPYFKNWPPQRSDPDSNHSLTWNTIYPYREFILILPPVLKKGMQSPWVKELQVKLISLGYWHLSTDGKFGIFTNNAIRSWQKKKGLIADGQVGPKTLLSLEI